MLLLSLDTRVLPWTAIGAILLGSLNTFVKGNIISWRLYVPITTLNVSEECRYVSSKCHCLEDTIRGSNIFPGRNNSNSFSSLWIRNIVVMFQLNYQGNVVLNVKLLTVCWKMLIRGSLLLYNVKEKQIVARWIELGLSDVPGHSRISQLCVNKFSFKFRCCDVKGKSLKPLPRALQFCF